MAAESWLEISGLETCPTDPAENVSTTLVKENAKKIITQKLITQKLQI